MEEKVQNAFLFSLLVAFLSVSVASLDPYHQEFEAIESDLESFNTLSLPLHHVDSLIFNKTPEQLFHLRLQRDASRVKAFNKSRPTVPGSGLNFSSPVISGFPQRSGEYYMRIGIGTPPRYVSLSLDTGSDVTWLQCKPCKNCYNQTDPIFDPKKSTSFTGIPCNSVSCMQLEDSAGCNQKNQCQYKVTYGDGSSTSGDFCTETLTFGKTRLERVAFGCYHEDSSFGGDGLIGMGGGSLSFPSQIGIQFNKKFSYCLEDAYHSRKPSSIIFGSSAIPRTTRFTPLLKNIPMYDVFYYVELLGISVGGIPVHGISPSLFRLKQDGDGGVFIDSGTVIVLSN
ncbi:aspartyl protease family protein 2-like [Lotus japonicus]|uniref:aspartyl protease family protein 2-like n=1 Tax=Lotus japonicus TaxID=34305 RepID=UPI00258CFC3C|nr:aspartyl protease family protein 2-like [Lotus japonicus]